MRTKQNSVNTSKIMRGDFSIESAINAELSIDDARELKRKLHERLDIRYRSRWRSIVMGIGVPKLSDALIIERTFAEYNVDRTKVWEVLRNESRGKINSKRVRNS